MIDIQGILNYIQSWLTTNILVKDGLYQLIFFVIAWVLSSLLNRFFIKFFVRYKSNFVHILTSFIFPIIFLFITYLGQVVASYLYWKNPALSVGINFILGWIVIKIINLISLDEYLKKILKYFVWIFLVLNILDLRIKFENALDNIKFSIGSINLSLLSLIKGGLFLIFLIWISKRLSDKINMEIQKNSNLDAGLKALISKGVNLSFVTIATLIALNSMGLNLTAFTVFGGAFSVGIGFGLQKSVSNLISGLILLLDKSVEPGDVIEVDGNYGIIKSMNARYITLSTVVGKEYLIPNENLITSEVVNWSFSDNLIRLTVEVGVAYHSDIEKVMGILVKAALSTHRVLKKPEPIPFLKNFGNSSIDMEIHFWISDPENGVERAKSDVRFEIWKLFKKENIEIPFPQQELYIKEIPH
jgi:small-conductance mechanosensitive channel